MIFNDDANDSVDAPHRIAKVEDYAQFVGDETVDRILKKAKPLHDLHAVNVNSTMYGGGVAKMLSSFALLMNSAGIKTGWRAIQGSPDYFSTTKKIHNALQGGDIDLTDRKKQIYEYVIEENSIRNHLDHDIVMIHDPQPLPMVNHYKKRGPWIWRCHIDLSQPNQDVWEYLKPFIEKYDAVVMTLEDYRQDLETPQVFIQPAIDPFCTTNIDLSEEEIDERLDHYDIPTDLPLVVQISRFDRWKDPKGVIDAFKKARKEVDATLVLLGNVANDDPEGDQVYQSLVDQREERILILSHQDTALVNALQRRATVVLQKSLREGFGLTVAEAMWKGAAVIGGNVGGIRKQIVDGENGFLVSSVDEAAQRIVQLLKDDKLRKQVGDKARQTVKQRYLLSRYLEDYLDLFRSFVTTYHVRGYN
ncbi:MAG: glycosyltransferase [Candidatus Zixiibacteriota bacterium]|jgi:trehalose synthase